MKFYTVEKLSPRQSMTPDGFLIVTDTIIARCGNQIYHHNEVPLDPGDDGMIVVSRDASEVFRPESIASFEGKPIVDDHPDEEVTPQNWRDLAVGHVQNVRRGTGTDDDCLVADLVFTDPHVIEKVRGRKKLALSAGYDAVYESLGRGKGAQRKIVANHVALVDEGRCGARCSIGDSGQAIYSYVAALHVKPAHDHGCGCDACATHDHAPKVRTAKRGGKWLHIWNDGVAVWRGRIGRARDFDPAEPRDPKGEWTAGGGTQGAVAAHAAEARKPFQTSGEIDIGDATATINPSYADMARILEATPNKELRALHEGSRFVVWPADAALHQTVQRALGMSDSVHRYILSGREGRPDRDSYPHQVGRYALQVRQDGQVQAGKFMPKLLRSALHIRDAWADFDPSEPRKSKGEGGGQWTSGGGGGTGTGRAAARRPRSAVFVSPSVAEHLDFPAAVSGLGTNRQKMLEKASAEIDQGLGLKSHDMGAVGAWSDGAENSIMTEVEGGTFDQLRVAAAMKAHIAEQKAALVFQQAPGGKAMLYSFDAKGDLSSIHKNLLEDGVEFHTVIPTHGGATVYVVDTEGTAHDAVEHAAERYGATPEFQAGHAEFIPADTKQDGSDAEQRAYSQQGYERIIAGAGVAGGAALWQRIHHAYGASLHGTQDDFDPNEPRNDIGEWTAGGGGGGGTTSISSGLPYSGGGGGKASEVDFAHHDMMKQTGFTASKDDPDTYTGPHIDPKSMNDMDSYLKTKGFQHVSHAKVWTHPDMTHLEVTGNDPTTGSTVKLTKMKAPAASGGKPSETFKKGEAITTTPLNGKPFKSWIAPKTNEAWDTLASSYDGSKKFDEPPLPPLTAGKHQGAGVIIREPDGRVWIVHPTNEYGGYKATFPKGTVEPGMTLKGTALKEAFEESGLGVRLTGYAGDIERDTSVARYYYAERMDGTPADAGWESQAVTLSPVEELKTHLNKKVDHDIVDLIMGGKVKAAVTGSAKTPKTYDPSGLGEPDFKIGPTLAGGVPVAQAAAAAKQAAPGALPDISKWKKTSSNKGSNPGGQYTDENGKLHYVKLQKSNDHAKNEFLAARLFEAAGSPVLDTQLVDLGGGKLGTHTEWKDKTNIDLNDPAHLKMARENFATNAWLANWDAIGMGQHEDDWNQAIVDGKMTTVDPGGSMIFRAQGGPKGNAWGDSVGEWDTMRHGNNPQANKAYGGMTNRQLRDSVLKVVKIPDKTIMDLTAKHGPGDPAARQALAARLIARKRDLIKRAMGTQDAWRRLARHIHLDLAA